MLKVGETERLIIRHFDLADALFIIEQLNQASFIRFITDKKVRNIDQARQYLTTGPLNSYQQWGYGLNGLLLKESESLIGMCGLVVRPELDHPDLGYALLPQYWGQGLALEAAKAVLRSAENEHNLEKVLAVTMPDNLSSNNLLKKAGFIYQSEITLYQKQNYLYEYSIKAG